MTTADLAWDYTAVEGSPLLSGAASELRRSETKCVLTQRQVLHLLNNLQEVSQILNDGNRRNSIATIRQTQQTNDVDPSARGNLSSVSSDIYRRCGCYKLKVTHLYLLLTLFLMLSLLVDSLVDVTSYPHIPYTSIVISFVVSLGVALSYFILVWKVIRRKGTPMVHLLMSYVVTCFFFASMYTALPCSQVKETSFHILNYLNNFQVSLSVLTLSYYGQLQFQCWNSLTFISIQMIVSYCHLILTLLTLIPKVVQLQKTPNLDNLPQFVEDPLVITQVPFDDAASYTFNQNTSLYGSTDVLERDFDRTVVHSCPPSVCEIPVN